VATARTGEATSSGCSTPARRLRREAVSGDHLLARISAVLRRRGVTEAVKALDIASLHIDLARACRPVSTVGHWI